MISPIKADVPAPVRTIRQIALLQQRHSGNRQLEARRLSMLLSERIQLAGLADPSVRVPVVVAGMVWHNSVLSRRIPHQTLAIVSLSSFRFTCSRISS